MRVQLHCIAKIHVVYLKEVYLLASLWFSHIVQSSFCGAPFFLSQQRQNVRLIPTIYHGRKNELSRNH
uniref:Ycf15 n=1 Tax=Zygophyllum xanthoxylum TaxID=90549 RepID=A0A7G9M1I4_9ROSI|nr:Ycf15 [Zygophyllum xanthoxylum]QNM99202.1 Ycf15 [Zygophyllum xanthoxylum]